MKSADPGSLVTTIGGPLSASFFHSSSQQQQEIEMHLFILYNLQLEIVNFLYKNLRKAAG